MGATSDQILQKKTSVNLNKAIESFQTESGKKAEGEMERPSVACGEY